MSIIMVDCDDSYRRADIFEKMSQQCAEYANAVGEEAPELSAGMKEYSEKFATLCADIRAATDVWTDFYVHNVRTD